MFMESLEMPRAAPVSMPNLETGFEVDGGAIDVRFQPVPLGEVVFALIAAVGGNRLNLKCSFPGTAGMGQVPADGVARFLMLAGEAPRLRVVSFVEDYRRRIIDGWEIRVAARTSNDTVEITRAE